MRIAAAPMNVLAGTSPLGLLRAATQALAEATAERDISSARADAGWLPHAVAIMAIAMGVCPTGASANPLGTGQPRARLAQVETSEPRGIFRGVGIIKAIDPRSGALTLAHEEIKGLMPAMEMMYRVKSRALSEGLREGDKIEFS